MDAREVFLEVVDRGSFTEAARRLGISLSYASRRVRSLEKQLGVTLLARTTRRIRLTPEGERYHAELGPLFRGLRALEEGLASGGSELRGTLRVSAPLSFGLSTVQPMLEGFSERWPEVLIDVSFNDRQVDPLDFDVTIRGGKLSDSAFVARRLLGFRAVITASPAYLAARGTPTTPAELAGHDGIHYTAYQTMDGWQVGGVRVQLRSRYRADNGDALVSACVAGLGIGYQPDFLCREALAAGQLVPILEDCSTNEGAFWAIRRVRTRTPVVAAFIEHLVECFGEMEEG